MCIEQRQGALVVIDGDRRLRWQGNGASWRVTGLWPSQHEREDVMRQVEAGTPLLVVLSPAQAVVPAFREEVRQLPPGVRIGGGDGDLVDLQVTPMDWLPAPVRQRGERFLIEARVLIKDASLSSLPPLLVEPGSGDNQSIRFAVRTPSCQLLGAALLEAAVIHAFSSQPSVAA